MNVITLLSGIPGVGKSTFIKENGLEPYTISTDSIRLMLATPVKKIDENGQIRETIDNVFDGKVFKILHELVDTKMLNGEFIIVDAQHVSRKSQKELLNLAKKHGYRMNVLDLQEDMSLKQILEQNSNREGYKFVPEKSIQRQFMLRKHTLETGNLNISGSNLIKKKDFAESLIWKSSNLDSYEKVVLIGDIHGCYDALKEGLGELNDNYFYVFLGDFFDRGIQNKEVLGFLLSIASNKNVVFLKGNHEIHLINFLKRDKDNKYKIGKEFLTKTIKQLLSKGDYTLKDLTKLVKSLQSVFAFSFNGQEYICTHGGIMPQQYNKVSKGRYNMIKENEREIILGIGNYSTNIDKIYNDYMINLPEEDKVIQFHGHRNSFNVSLDAYKYIYNLEGKVEFGGYLRIVEITKQGIETKEIKNNTFNEKLLLDDNLSIDLTKLTNKEIKEKLEASRYIRSKKFNDLTAYNFTTDAFSKGIWNSFTLSARGLILKDNGDIHARGYNKFFNLNENEETQLDKVKEKVVYPVKAIVKENGYLGIQSTTSGKLNFYSKSGKTEFGDLFATMFYKQIKKTGNPKNIPVIAKLLQENNVSVTYEVVNIETDKHIVEYKESKLVILDVIENSYNLVFRDDLKQELLKLTGFETPEFTLINNDSELDTFLENAEKESNTEGYVFKDSENYMFKYKSDEYRFIKYIRGIVTFINKNRISDLQTLGQKYSKNEKVMQALIKLQENNLLNIEETDIYKIREVLFENNLI